MSLHKLFRKKKRLGFTEKPAAQRTREEVNNEYNHHAIMYGHITRMMAENQKLLDEHLEALCRLNTEALRLPPEKAPESAPEGQAKLSEPTPA